MNKKKINFIFWKRKSYLLFIFHNYSGIYPPIVFQEIFQQKLEISFHCGNCEYFLSYFYLNEQEENQFYFLEKKIIFIIFIFSQLLKGFILKSHFRKYSNRNWKSHFIEGIVSTFIHISI